MGLSVSKGTDPPPELVQYFGWTPDMIERAVERAVSVAPKARMTRAMFWETFTDYSVLRGTSFVNIDQHGYDLFAPASKQLCRKHVVGGAHQGRYGESFGTADAAPDVDVRFPLFFLTLACDTAPESQAALFRRIYLAFRACPRDLCWVCGCDLIEDAAIAAAEKAASVAARLRDAAAASSRVVEAAAAMAAVSGVSMEPCSDDAPGTGEPATTSREEVTAATAAAMFAAGGLRGMLASAASSRAASPHAAATASGDAEADPSEMRAKEWGDVIMWILRAAKAVGLVTGLPARREAVAVAEQVTVELEVPVLGDEQVSARCGGRGDCTRWQVV